jgi:hypothetical protein
MIVEFLPQAKSELLHAHPEPTKALLLSFSQSWRTTTQRAAYKTIDVLPGMVLSSSLPRFRLCSN